MSLDRARLVALIANLPPANFPAPKPDEQSGQPARQPYMASTQDPGPSSHPQALPTPENNEVEEGSGDDISNDNGSSDNKMPPVTPSQTPGGRKSRNGAAMGSDELTRQRKVKNREVERRRLRNINEGIKELGRIVPTGSGEQGQAAILSRAIQYIHDLKENEARNMEKSTLQKLLIDQAMAKLEEERIKRMRLELEQDLETSRKGIKRSPDEAHDAKDHEDRNKKQRLE